MEKNRKSSMVCRYMACRYGVKRGQTSVGTTNACVFLTHLHFYGNVVSEYYRPTSYCFQSRDQGMFRCEQRIASRARKTYALSNIVSRRTRPYSRRVTGNSAVIGIPIVHSSCDSSCFLKWKCSQSFSFNRLSIHFVFPRALAIGRVYQCNDCDDRCRSKK